MCRNGFAWLFLIAGTMSGLLSGPAYAEKTRPNIVVIMADDLGLGDVGRHHRQQRGTEPLAPTPQLDALADEGIWFTDAHSPTALCSPSRYAVMSGAYNYRSYAPWGVWGSFRKNAITPDDATLGRVAQQAGYRTGFIGKWHLGGDFGKLDGQGIYRGDDRGDTPLKVDARRWLADGPQDLGFDYDFTLPTGVQGPFYVAYENGVWHPLASDSQLIHLDKTTASDPLFVSDKGPGTGDSAWDARKVNILLAEKAATFIQQASANEPFFLCYWSPAVHVPHAPPAELEGEPIKGTTPSRHSDMNRVLDWEVEQIVQALKATGEYENTLILLTSDNGGLRDGKAAKAGHHSNGGWRGSKNLPYEGGHRVPLIVVWPSVIEAGQESSVLVNGTDLVATVADVVGVSLTESQAPDSHSIYPLLRGEGNFQPRTEVLLQAGSHNELIYRQGDWKLILQSDNKLTKYDPIALFHLGKNPTENEAQNLVDTPEQADRVARMLKRYLAIRESGDRTAPFTTPLSSNAR